MLKIFISYSREDTDFVDRLEQDLIGLNYKVWVDRRKIEGGQDWQQALRRAIENADVVVLVMSPDAVQSKYVTWEWKLALNWDKALIPLKYRTVKSVPDELRKLNWIVEFEGDTNFGRKYQAGLKKLHDSLQWSARQLMDKAKGTRMK